jgi:predicted ABC-type ATPase
MVGGPGAGKSFIARRELAGVAIVDCDAIKAEYPEYNPERPQDVHEKSSQEATRRVFAAISRSESVVFDSTGTNPDKLAMFASAARSAGFRVEALFVVCDLSVAMARAAARARKVPMEIVREKHAAVSDAWLVVRAFVDSARMIENN